MRELLSILTVITAILYFASAEAFSPPSQFRDLYKSMTMKLSSFSTSSKYNSKDAEIFLKDIHRVISLGPVPISERQFLINGWRWHTASALRDLQRYADVIDKIDEICDPNQFVGESTQEDFKNRLISCYSYVCDYNLKALMKIESELFFPWLEKLLPEAARPLMSEIVQDQADAKALSAQIGKLCKSLSGNVDDCQLIKKIGLKVKEIKKSYIKIQGVQETVFVPYITAYIPRKEQERFNRGVISKLGFIKAQVHLCGMIEAIEDQPSEMTLLRSQIPSIAQATLPLWKRRLYDPKTACLNFSSQ